MKTEGQQQNRSEYALLDTAPYGEKDDDPELESHLAVQAKKYERIIREHFATKPKHGLTLSVLGDRGAGKSTFVNYLRRQLEWVPDRKNKLSTEDPRWIIAEVDWEMVEASSPPRQQVLLFLAITRAIESLAESLKKCPENEIENISILQKAVSELKSCANDLKKYAASMGLTEEAASNATLAFAKDISNFKEEFTTLSLEAGFAVKEFAERLRKFCQANSSVWRLCLIVEDCDLVSRRRVDLAFGTLLASSYLAEEGGILRVATANKSGIDWLLKQKFLWMPPHDRRGLWRRLAGHSVFVSPMNEIRKLSFLASPMPKLNASHIDGRVIWLDALGANEHRDGEPSTSSREKYEDFIDELIQADLHGRQADLREWRATEFKQILLSRLGLNAEDITSEKATDDKAADLVESVKSLTSNAKTRLERLRTVVDLLPGNRRAMVSLTNALIQQRRQALDQDQPFDRRPEYQWVLPEGRLARILLCVANERWPDTMLRQLLWSDPSGAAEAVHWRAIIPRQVDDVVIEPGNAPVGSEVRQVLERMKDELEIPKDEREKRGDEAPAMRKLLRLFAEVVEQSKKRSDE